MKVLLRFSLLINLLIITNMAWGTLPQQADVIVYGGTAGGAVAAVAVAREGKTVLLLESSRHLGGLTTGGLGATDIGNKGAIGGISREFYERIHQHYVKPDVWKWQKYDDFFKLGVHQERSKDPLVEKTGKPTMWTFEPRVAMQILRDMLREAKVDIQFEQRLVSVKKEGGHLVEITMENGNVFRGRMFIDATYEGDLMAKAGVSYTVGREANSKYDETLNGVRAQTPHHQFKVQVDPYMKAGDPSSGLLPFIQSGNGGVPGNGDKCVQAYNFRLCMTQVSENKLPWTAPAGYDAKKYELLARYIEALVAAGKPPKVGQLMNPVLMPNGKTDTNNNGPFSSDFIGNNYDYPDGDYATRARIWKAHEDYIRGFLYFLATSPRVPQYLRDEMNSWGLAKDEFAEAGGWPPQMYVREARRMISDYVMTEHECRWERTAEDGVGLGAYGMDSHNCQRIVKNGYVENEGDVQVRVRGPYPISYRSIVPKAGECENLFVPVCMSATHIAYGSIRMEPVFMILGQSSAIAAVIAINDNVPVQKVSYKKLSEKLKEQKQIITNEAFDAPNTSFPHKLEGIVVDDIAARVTGEWKNSQSAGPFVGDGYLHDDNSDKGQKCVRFTPKLPAAGKYEVRITYTPLANRAKNVPVVIHSVDGEKTIKVNEKQPLKNNQPLLLGIFNFEAGTNGWVEVRNDGTKGHVIADAIQFVPVK